MNTLLPINLQIAEQALYHLKLEAENIRLNIQDILDTADSTLFTDACKRIDECNRVMQSWNKLLVAVKTGCHYDSAGRPAYDREVLVQALMDIEDDD